MRESKPLSNLRNMTSENILAQDLFAVKTEKDAREKLKPKYNLGRKPSYIALYQLDI